MPLPFVVGDALALRLFCRLNFCHSETKQHDPRNRIVLQSEESLPFSTLLVNYPIGSSDR